MREKFICDCCGIEFNDRNKCIGHEALVTAEKSKKENNKPQKPTHRVRFPVGNGYVDFKRCYSEEEANAFADEKRVTSPEDRLHWVLIETAEELLGYLEDPIRKEEGSPCSKCHQWYTTMEGYNNCTKDCLHLYDFLEKKGIEYKYSKPSFYKNIEKNW